MKKLLYSFLISLLCSANLLQFWYANELENEVSETIWEIQQHVEVGSSNTWWLWEWIKDFVIDIAQKVMIPAWILIWLIVAIIWFFNMMISEKEEQQKKWRDFLLWWIIGIMIMMTAYYVAIKLVWYSGTSWEILSFNALSWLEVAKTLYSNFFFPILKILTYLIIWILFIILLIHAIKLILSPWDDMQKKSTTIIIWNLIGILVIIFAKNLVELVYGSNPENAFSWSTLTPWEAILENASSKFGFIHTSINWILWFVAFIILVIIIYQSLLLVMKPDDAETTKKIWKNFIYVFVWILIIWAWYLITNFFIVKG